MMRCAACERTLDQSFTGDVCPHCDRFVQPTRLGSFARLELIRRGGMGAVYRGEHPELGTPVAIKLMHASAGVEGMVERFERETKVTARIAHPGVVRVYDSDCREGRLYLVMEFVDGQTLRERFCGTDGSALPPIATLLDLCCELLDCLHAAHEVGVVHRDVKPENVMLDATGRVRVLDFGISRLLDADAQLTRTGEILGTPEYLAPEQILDVAEAVDPRTDVHAVGVVLYELLTGRSPFAGDNLFAVLKHVESRVPPAASTLRTEIPPELDHCLAAALAKDPAERPQSAAAFARRLRAVRSETIDPSAAHSSSPRRASAAGTALGLTLAAAAGFGLARIWPTVPPTTEPNDTAAAEAAASRRAADLEQFDSLLDLALPTTHAPARARRLVAIERSLTQPGTLTQQLIQATAAPVGAERGAALASLLLSLERTAPQRYLIGAARAMHEDNLDALRSCCELAAATGAADRAAAWFVIGRTWIAGSNAVGVQLGPEDSAELLAVFDRLSPADRDPPPLSGLGTAVTLLAWNTNQFDRARTVRDQADAIANPACARWRQPDDPSDGSEPQLQLNLSEPASRQPTWRSLREKGWR